MMRLYFPVQHLNINFTVLLKWNEWEKKAHGAYNNQTDFDEMGRNLIIKNVQLCKTPQFNLFIHIDCNKIASFFDTQVLVHFLKRKSTQRHWLTDWLTYVQPKWHQFSLLSLNKTKLERAHQLIIKWCAIRQNFYKKLLKLNQCLFFNSIILLRIVASI